MSKRSLKRRMSNSVRAGVLASVVAAPAIVDAQSPFDSGAENLILDFQTLATPIAVLVVIALGIAALAGRISWGWPIAAIAGIAVIFGAQEIVTWIQGVFGFA